jgi:uncharacterized protein YqjF (DUF2071 family)
LWKYYQEWNNVIFLHWKADYEALRKLVPAELEIDMVGGSSWISLVAFTMDRIRPRNFPAFKPVSWFDEINIRTYVRYRNKPGVYFLSIEGGKLISCAVARTLSMLPYRYSRIDRSEGTYTSANSVTGDSFSIVFSGGESLGEKTNLDRWLTERYALFQDTRTFIRTFEIHHVEWPVNELHIERLEINYPGFNNLLKGNPVKAHYSRGVQVIAWGTKTTEG